MLAQLPTEGIKLASYTALAFSVDVLMHFVQAYVILT